VTNDDMRDEVPVPHYEDELWRTLARVHADQAGQGGQADQAGQAGQAEIVDLRARRRGRRMVLAGIGSIAAAAIALAAVVVTDDDGSSDAGTEAAETESPTTGTPDTPELSLAAQITAATEEASETSIIHTLRDNHNIADDGTPIGDDEDWTDEQSGARRDLSYDSEGEVSFDSGRAVAPGVDDPGPPPIPPNAQPFDPSLPQERIRTVDHCFSEYAEYDQAAIPGHIEADRLGEWLDEGTLVEDGTETVDGRELIRLVEVPAELRLPENVVGGDVIVPVDPETGAPMTTTEPPTTAPPTTDPATLDPDTFENVEHIYLVDAETFRPVRVIGYPGEAPDYSDAMYVATTEYLPRTPENMALLSPPVPDGFDLVPELRGDGERLDQCGW
jgi:hypothetical protein